MTESIRRNLRRGVNRALESGLSADQIMQIMQEVVTAGFPEALPTPEKCQHPRKKEVAPGVFRCRDCNWSSFRDCGKTINALYYRLSVPAQHIIAEHNGISHDKLPEAFKYASNQYMRDWLEELAYHPQPRLEDGRWRPPTKLN